MNKHAKLLVDMPSDRRWRSFQELMLTINTRYDHGWFGWFRRWWKWEVNCLLRDLVEHRMVEQRWDSENQRMEFRVTDSGVMIQVSYWIEQHSYTQFTIMEIVRDESATEVHRGQGDPAVPAVDGVGRGTGDADPATPSPSGGGEGPDLGRGSEQSQQAGTLLADG